MTTVTYTFDLNNYDGEDRTHVKQVAHAVDSLAALWDITQLLRQYDKYDDTLDEKQHELIGKLRDEVAAILTDNHIDLDELFS